jgi:hypothetical protein
VSASPSFICLSLFLKSVLTFASSCFLCRIIFGLNLVYTVAAVLRLGAAKKMVESDFQDNDALTEDFIKKLQVNRTDLKEAGTRDLGWTGGDQRTQRLEDSKKPENQL